MVLAKIRWTYNNIMSERLIAGGGISGIPGSAMIFALTKNGFGV